MKFLRCFFLFLPVLFLVGSVWAGEQIKLGEVVVTPTMGPRLLADAPGSVEVITQEDIQGMNAVSVDEALEEAAGLTVSRHSGRTRSVSVRGSRSEHTLVLLNGRRLASGFNERIDLRQIPVVMIERIEVVRGPASALYGSDAIGGVVNIITKAPPEELSGGLSFQYSQNRSGQAREPWGSFLVGGPLADNLRASFAAQLRDKSGWDESGARPDDGFKEEALSLFGNLEYDVGDWGLLAGEIEYIRENHFGEHDRRNRFQERDYDAKRRGYSLKFDANLAENQSLFFKANRSEHKFDMEFNPIAAPYQGGERALGDRDARQYLHQFLSRYSWQVNNNSILTLGAEYLTERIKGVNEEEVSGPGGSSTGLDVGFNESVNNFSTFIQNEFLLFNTLDVLLGMRYDKHSQSGQEVTGRAAVVYPVGENFRLKGGFSQGFKAPTLSQLYIDTYRRRGQDEYLANPNLEAETANSAEVGFEVNNDTARLGLTYFFNRIDNLIYAEDLGGNQFQYQNLSKATIQGVEFSGETELALGFSLKSNLTWTHLDDDMDQDAASDFPEYRGNLKLQYQLPEWQLAANLRMSYFGNAAYDAGKTRSYGLFSFHSSKGFGENLEFFAGISNMFNKQYERNNVTQVEPRTFYSGVRYQF